MSVQNTKCTTAYLSQNMFPRRVDIIMMPVFQIMFQNKTYYEIRNLVMMLSLEFHFTDHF